MLSVLEYVIPLGQVSSDWCSASLPDGWRPLDIVNGPGPGEYTLSVMAQTQADMEREVFRLVLPGEDLEEITEREGVELAFIGRVKVPGKECDGYVFVDVQPEVPQRRITHPKLLE